MKNICILILYFAEIVSWCVWFTHHWRWSTNKIFKALCMFPSENKEVVPVALVHLTEGYTLSMTIFHLRLESLCTVVLPLTCALLNPEIIGIVWSLLISHVCAEMTLSGDNLPSDMLNTCNCYVSIAALFCSIIGLETKRQLKNGHRPKIWNKNAPPTLRLQSVAFRPDTIIELSLIHPIYDVISL